MNDNQSAGREYNWDDEISQDSAEFALLPEGEYEFSVTGFERGRYPGGAAPRPSTVHMIARVKRRV